MTLSEALSEGLLVTAVGIIIVFSVLIILMLTMIAMKKIFYKEEKADVSEAPAPVPAPAPAVQPESVPAPVQTTAEDPNLIAVLAAAVAASLNTSTYNLKIRSYRRIGNNAPDWNKAGLRDTIDSRF